MLTDTETRSTVRAKSRAIGQARERLNLALDGLGDRPPTSSELGALVRLASAAFAPSTAAARMLRLLVVDRATQRSKDL